MSFGTSLTCLTALLLSYRSHNFAVVISVVSSRSYKITCTFDLNSHLLSPVSSYTGYFWLNLMTVAGSIGLFLGWYCDFDSHPSI